MEIVTKYKATDGTEWATTAECDRRDRLDAEIRAIEARLGPPVERGRRRVDVQAMEAAKVAIVAICRREWPHEAVFQYPAHEIHPMSWAGRLLSDVGGPINRVWYRFSCTRGEWEYEQPYFALNPEKFVASEYSPSVDAVDPHAEVLES